MSDQAVIITAFFTFLGTLVVSIRMCLAWYYRHQIELVKTQQAKDLKVLETQKSNTEKAIADLKKISEEFKKQLEEFKTELKKIVEKYAENQISHMKLMKTVHEYMILNEKRVGILEEKVGSVVVKAGNGK